MVLIWFAIVLCCVWFFGFYAHVSQTAQLEYNFLIFVHHTLNIQPRCCRSMLYICQSIDWYYLWLAGLFEIHLLNTYLLSVYYIPGTILGSVEYQWTIQTKISAFREFKLYLRVAGSKSNIKYVTGQQGWWWKIK